MYFEGKVRKKHRYFNKKRKEVLRKMLTKTKNSAKERHLTHYFANNYYFCGLIYY